MWLQVSHAVYVKTFVGVAKGGESTNSDKGKEEALMGGMNGQKKPNNCFTVAEVSRQAACAVDSHHDLVKSGLGNGPILCKSGPIVLMPGKPSETTLAA